VVVWASATTTALAADGLAGEAAGSVSGVPEAERAIHAAETCLRAVRSRLVSGARPDRSARSAGAQRTSPEKRPRTSEALPVASTQRSSSSPDIGATVIHSAPTVAQGVSSPKCAVARMSVSSVRLASVVSV
jgi:hypothetical protein